MIFSKLVFSAFIKLSGNQRTYWYSGGSGLSIDIHFVDTELSYDVLSPLPIVLSKHFNHPHPYIEIATAISARNQDWKQITCTYTWNIELFCIVTNVINHCSTKTKTQNKKPKKTSTHFKPDSAKTRSDGPVGMANTGMSTTEALYGRT